MKKFVIFRNNKCKFKFVWNTRNVRSLKLKIMLNITGALIVYEGNSLCGEKYVSESVRNVFLRCTKHEDANKQSELAKHFKYIRDYQFEWKVPTKTPEYTGERKVLEEFLLNL